jgi:hypothetical protein
MRKAAIMIALVLAGCDRFPEKTTMNDPRVKELARAAASFDRTAHGFTPGRSLAKGDCAAGLRVNVEHLGISPAVMCLNLNISFRRNGYTWISEQEVFRGPRRYSTVDGTSNESITFTYEVEKVAHDKLNALNIDYLGDDPRLESRFDLSLGDVDGVLREWGYER